jgi:hypothetical protein
MKPNVQATKENIDNLNFIKIKNFCASRYFIRKVNTVLGL